MENNDNEMKKAGHQSFQTDGFLTALLMMQYLSAIVKWDEKARIVIEYDPSQKKSAMEIFIPKDAPFPQYIPR